jgi:hypothetical protein
MGDAVFVAFKALAGAIPIILAVFSALFAVWSLANLPGRRRLRIGNLIDFETMGAKEIKRELAEEVRRGTSPHSALMQEYHAQGLSQSRVSFWFSLVFAALGFMIIAIAVGLFLQTPTAPGASFGDNIGKPAFTLVAGTIVDAVAALFFVQSNKARQLMTDFFDKLRVDRKLDEALSLIGAIREPGVASRAQAIVALNFSDVQITDAILATMLKADATTSAPPDGPQHRAHEDAGSRPAPDGHAEPQRDPA